MYGKRIWRLSPINSTFDQKARHRVGAGVWPEGRRSGLGDEGRALVLEERGRIVVKDSSESVDKGTKLTYKTELMWNLALWLTVA